MSSDVWFISDTHFGHANALKFLCDDGKPMRSFDNVQAMDEHMVACWNSVVKPQDKVYHLGDVVINKNYLPTLFRLNGHKRLVRGNHDIFPTKTFMEYFEEIYGVRVFAEFGFVCSHIPIHTESLSRWKLNVHGHLHCNTVMLPDELHMDGTITKSIDPRYMSVCVEKINYTPIHIDVIRERVKELSA